MESYKKIILAGNISAIDDLKETPKGGKVVNFSLACNNRDNNTDFFRFEAWDKRAEFATQYLKVGMPILIEGIPFNRTYKDNDGITRTQFRVRATAFKFLPDGKNHKADELPAWDEYAAGHDPDNDLPF